MLPVLTVADNPAVSTGILFIQVNFICRKEASHRLCWFLSGLPAFVVRQAMQSCLEPANIPTLLSIHVIDGTRKKTSLLFANLFSFGITSLEVGTYTIFVLKKVLFLRQKKEIRIF